MNQWRTFQFFEKQLIKEEGTTEPNQELKKLNVVCASSGRGTLVLGDLNGAVHFVERDFKISYSFQAYIRTVTLIEQVKQKNILVTVGEDEEAISPTVKIWNLDKIDADGFPDLVRVIKMPNPVPVTVLAATADLSQMAIGVCDGSIVVVAGDILRERASRLRVIKAEDSQATGGPSPITGLGFSEQRRGTYLFASTTSSVYCYMTNKEGVGKGELLDDRGCEAGCAAMNEQEGEFISGRKEAIYFYNILGPGPCLAFEAAVRRHQLFWFRNHLISVDQTPNNPNYHTVTVYEPRNKFIAFTASFQKVTNLAFEWGNIYVIQADGKIFQMSEKDTQTKLDTLFKKNLYTTAIDLAHSNQYDANAIVDIFRKYGDHLYSKGDYDVAIDQYIKTIGRLEPSYVIKKFLDAQRIHNLTLYLQKLHEAGLANANHTTLLLNCYTKLKDVDKLNKFIKTPDLKFDVETAIKVCRQAGYHEHALDLALRQQEHKWYLKILLEDLHQHEQALKYIQTLPFEEAEDNLLKYGKQLVSALPQQTLRLLMELCTNYVPKKSDESLPAKPKARDSEIIDERDLLMAPAKRAAAQSVSEQEKKKAVAEKFIPLFVSQPLWLMEFLEFIIVNGRGTQVIYDTLLELYLKDLGNEFARPKSEEKTQSEKSEKIMTLLTNPNAKYDEGQALVLCQMYNFKGGLLYLYEKLKMYGDIVEFHMENNEYDLILKACKKYGDKDPNIWVKALSYFANKDPKIDCRREISEVLQSIESDSLLPPLQVLQILSQSKTATLGLVKQYIIRNLNREQAGIEKDLKQIREYQEQTERNKKEIEELRTTARIFQQMKCTHCGKGLDLPAVHFLCMHSFHQRCLDENESVCPKCNEENKNFEQLQHSLEENSHDHSEFFRQLESSSDGFAIVARYFGRGMFNRSNTTTASQRNNIPAIMRLPSLEPGLFAGLENLK
jgi:hypothetical protein